ncbi:MAG: hypothetical protein C0478_14925 [Planctomyces sp.]|nr:hypothetical protein [Planctomyces sp.]
MLEQPMNVSTKRFLCGLAVCGAVAGQAQAQESGTVRITDDFSPGVGGSEAPGVATFSAPAPVLQPMSQPAGSYSMSGGQVPPGFRTVDEIFNPIFRVDTRGGQLYGYDEGYTSVGGFMPFFRDENSLIFTDVRGLMTNGGQGGANVGVGYRQYVPELDRIFGISGWYDFDNGHRKAFNQFGVSFESIGRYLDWRVNGYLPVEDNEEVTNTILGAAGFQGNFILLNRGISVDSAYKGFDTEVGGPVPLLGRYGMSAYVGLYYYANNDVGSFTGVSGRFQQRINEDLTLNVAITDDHTFGTNAQIQVIADLPNGFPSRWAREKPVRQRLRDPVMRNYRVTVEERLLVSQEFAIDPEDGNPYFVAHIDPNLAGPGNGTFEDQFGSLLDYTNLQANKGDVDFIYVRPRADGTSTNLDTGITLINPAAGGDTQRLWSTSVEHTVAIDASQGGGTFILPGFTGVGSPLPVLTNTAPGDVVTLTTNDVRFDISGFDIQAQPGTSGIAGINNQDVRIDRNIISGGLNGVLLTNLTGTGTSASTFSANTFRDNTADGVFVSSSGPLEVSVTDNFAFGNGDDGFQMQSNAGGTISGVISGNSTIGASQNGDDGFVLTANGGNVNFNNPANGFAITENVFSQNDGDGLALEITAAGGNIDAAIFANTFADNGDGVPATDSNGLHFEGVAGTANLFIGSADPTVARNQFTGNEDSGMLLEAAGTTVLAATVVNNDASGNTNGFAITQDGTATVGTLADPIIVTGNTASANQNGFLYATDGDLGAPIMQVASFDNIAIQNTVAGIAIQGSDEGLMNFQSQRDITGNGILGGNTGDGVNIDLVDNSSIVAIFENLTSNQNGGNGFTASATNTSDLAFLISSPDDPLFNVAPLPIGNQSSLSNNAIGAVVNSSLTAQVTGIFDEVSAIQNAGDGLQINRADASLMTISVTDTDLTNTRLSTYSQNGDDGIAFNYTGSDATDPNQPLSGTPNTLNISNTLANGNTGNGLETVGNADAVLVATVISSTFSQNIQSGINVTTLNGSFFGNSATATRSVFDNVTVTQNGSNGFTFLADDNIGVESDIFAQISSINGPTTISNNTGSGIAVDAQGFFDLLVVGDGAVGGDETLIQGNTLDGIGIDAATGDVILTVFDATIGGATPALGNGRDGIRANVFFAGSAEFNIGTGGLDTVIQNNAGDGVQMVLGQNLTGTITQTTGVGEVNINNADILDNGLDGVSLVTRAGESKTAGSIAILAVNITNGTVIGGNGDEGVEFDLRGRNFNTAINGGGFLIDSTTIENNGGNGVLFNADAGNTGFNQIQGNFPQPTAPVATPFDPDQVLAGQANANGFFNSPGGPTISTTIGNTVYSSFMNLTATNQNELTFTNNIVRFNGQNGAEGDGLFIRISTDSRLTADVGGADGSGNGNVFTGNLLSDFRTESFLKTVSVGGAAVAKPASTAVAGPALDTVVLDDTAQMDLRFFNNTGNSINNGTAFAIEQNEFLLDPFTGNAFNPNRLVQLFQVQDNGNLDTSNSFITGGIPQSVFFDFLGANFEFSSTFPNANFPRGYNVSPGNPFTP